MISLKKYLTTTSEETFMLGKGFSANLNPGDVVLMYGELGAGKTTFVQGVAEGFGIKDRVISPTFVIHKRHDVNMRNIKFLNHIDLYRIEVPENIKNLGIEEVIEDNTSITIIEWADRLERFKIINGYKMFFKVLNNDNHEIEIVKI